MKTLNMLMPDLDLSGDIFFTLDLDGLRDKGQLDIALSNFISYGTVIPMFFEASGPWSEFVPGHQASGIPVLNLRYEELAIESLDSDDNHSSASKNLSEFLNCDFHKIKNAFVAQGNSVRTKSSEGNLIFAKATSGYWRDYLTPSKCKRFANIYWRILIKNGYKDLVEELL